MQHGSKLFSDKLDRATFSAYFLGAIVPLLALAVVVQHFALPAQADRDGALALIALVVSCAVLSLGSFLVLRRITRRTLERMNRDNRRLGALLRVSSQLASVEHQTEATDLAVRAALDLAHASEAFLLVTGAEQTEPALAAHAGGDAEKRFETFGDELLELVALAVEGARPAVRAARDGASFCASAVPLPGERKPVGALVALRGGPDFAPEEIDALSTLAALAAVALRNGDLRDAQRNFFSHLTEMIVSALDAHLGFHQGHSARVAQLANHMGRALAFDDEQLERLHFAALLHDIGMLKLERAQAMNPRTSDRHALLGSRMLGRIRLWKDLAPVVHHHHEWFDGSGYPDGIAGEEIPLDARIIALCDAWDTMTNEASYKPQMSREDALADLQACSGTQFDPELVATFRALVERGEL